RNTLKGIFEAEGYEVLQAQDGAGMYRQLNSETVNLIVLDINLPGKNGLLLGRELREKTAIPLIFLTGRDNEVDKILGLEIGADDYLTKPFNPRELTIRARNLLHRTMTLNGKETHLQRENYRFNGWTLDLNSHNLITPEGGEFKLPLCENPGKLQTREELLQKMTGRELKPQDRTVDVTIRRIRKHFEDHPNTPEIIATVHGEGYRFCGELEE
ncbi:MAG: two-component system response regulator ArcA, partial [Haemophilus parainfluenzae]|nr:two-component system response regulator ArcA [Haemophilus parainfluenzae]